MSEIHPYNLKICIKVLLENRHYSSSKYKCFLEFMSFLGLVNYRVKFKFTAVTENMKETHKIL